MPSRSPLKPPSSTLPDLRQAAARCRACDSWRRATQTVFGEGALGATAAKALLGPDFRVTKDRGKLFDSSLGPPLMATVHPSSILRAPDEESRRVERQAFVADLRKARKFLS